MMDIALVEVNFDDPTTNVRGRRALAIAKPTPRGYWPSRRMINLTTRVCFLQEQARNWNCNLDIANKRGKLYWSSGVLWRLSLVIEHKQSMQSCSYGEILSWKNVKSKRWPKGCIYGGVGVNFVAHCRRGPQPTLTLFPHTYGLWKQPIFKYFEITWAWPKNKVAQHLE